MPREGKTSSRAFATSAVEKSGSGSGLDALAKRRLSARAVRHKFKKAFRNPLSVSEEPGLLQSATENRPAPSWSAWGRAAMCFRGMLSDATCTESWMPEPCSNGATQDANFADKEAGSSASCGCVWAREARGRKEVDQISAGEGVSCVA